MPLPTEFSAALTQERQRLHLTRRDVSDQCGVAEGIIRRWENAEAVPSRQQFKRLSGLIRRMSSHPPSWASPPTMEEQLRDFARIEPSPMTVTMPAPDDFGVGLRRIREDNGLSLDELGQLLNISGNSIRAWEIGQTVPVKENWSKLMEVLPELKIAIDVGAVRRPKWDPKDKADPGALTRGVPRPDGSFRVPSMEEAVERAAPELAKTDTAPTLQTRDQLAIEYASAMAHRMRVEQILTAKTKELEVTKANLHTARNEEQAALELLTLAAQEDG